MGNTVMVIIKICSLKQPFWNSQNASQENKGAKFCSETGNFDCTVCKRMAPQGQQSNGRN